MFGMVKGRNGKGVLIELMKKTLGKGYFKTLPLDYVIRTKEGRRVGAAEPELAEIKGARAIIIDEASNDQSKSNKVVLRSAKLKELTGRSQLKARMLHENPIEFVCQGTIIMATNDKPEWDATDDALKERFRYCPLRMRFISHPKNPNEREADKTLKNKIANDQNYWLAFFHILYSYLKELNIAEGGNIKVDMPETFQKENEEFADENNPIKQFINARIEITNDNNDKIKSTKIIVIISNVIKE